MANAQIKPHSASVKKAIALSWFTIVFNLVEGIVSIALGIQEGSVALAGFGADSLIEVASAFLILWRFREAISIERERRATLGIGVLFILLSVITAVTSAFQLSQHSHPSTTLPGAVISALSLSFMFFLWRAKAAVAIQLNSAAMKSDADCSLACIKLSGVLFVGSIVFLLLPSLWWLDSVAAIALAALVGKEGLSTVRAANHPDFSGGCGCN